MARSIFVEKNELRSAVGLMGAIIRSMEAIQQAILQIDLRAASDWQGRAAAQNVENFQTLNDMTTDYLVDAYGTKNALDLAITAYETTEQGQVAKVQNLSVQGIFS